jgi:hypothetical protein
MTTPPRTVAGLHAAAWHAFTTAGKPLTAHQLAQAAGITTGAAQRFLTHWRAHGRAVAAPTTGTAGPALIPHRPAPDTNRPRLEATPIPVSDVLPVVLGYAARGWHVIPLVPGGKRPAFPDHPETRCAGTDPRCRAAGRHVTWAERATTDPGRITRAWSNLTPHGPFGVGIACGPSGLVVVDLDTAKPDLTADQRARLTARLADHRLPANATGADVLTRLMRSGGHTLPATYTVVTPSGGRHLYFTAPPGVVLGNTAKSVGPLVDTRARGGQVVAPPTTVDGRPYRVLVDVDPAPLPAWIVAALTPTPRPAGRPGTVPLAATSGALRAGAYLRAALAAEARHVADAQPGRRGTAVYIAAANLGELVAGSALTADTVRAALTAAAAAHVGVGRFTAAEAAAAIESGLRKGACRPRRLTGEAA